jgi:hypothetical protein
MKCYQKMTVYDIACCCDSDFCFMIFVGVEECADTQLIDRAS